MTSANENKISVSDIQNKKTLHDNGFFLYQETSQRCTIKFVHDPAECNGTCSYLFGVYGDPN